ncbi:cupin domain-containing protein [Spirosoma utsteinense]|uniref:Quercetin dioxygenase-like cupin family protein n=1 Tax=Spirosoma utsteinense TaxID=2585773 RepID=A0ABR6WBN4_9BACT|nr:cupin domain-containing protein [Spirosoma utsteinense]MBC3785283.1 quercetin dioxygenase-like cupin family protein [Spirosoma utsteinense]MBC3793913.1 quercetin dioxygenase-like cupin family protein [Spirosoma utsteinense]
MAVTQSARLFVDDQSLLWETVGEGVKRKIMTYDANLMMVKVAFETGGVGAVHRHVHTQMSYVESGTFAITIADETQILRQGDVFYVPSNVWHGAVCEEAGMLVDVFTPMREDFV